MGCQGGWTTETPRLPPIYSAQWNNSLATPHDVKVIEARSSIGKPQDHLADGTAGPSRFMHLIALVVFLLPGHGCAGNPARKQRKRKMVSEFGPVHTALHPGREGGGRRVDSFASAISARRGTRSGQSEKKKPRPGA